MLWSADPKSHKIYESTYEYFRKIWVFSTSTPKFTKKNPSFDSELFFAFLQVQVKGHDSRQVYTIYKILSFANTDSFSWHVV